MTTPTTPIHLVECPRDAMQGWPHHISTKEKINYLNQLLQVGFDTLDMGGFVSPKAVPQMADTKEVLANLQIGNSPTKLLAIVANTRGAEEAVGFDDIHYLGFPFSISETFQQKNTHSSIAHSLQTVATIQNICHLHKKELVVYLSMAFGNPYGDAYSQTMVYQWATQLAELGIKTMALADTVGLATPEEVFSLTHLLIQQLPTCEIGLHLHAAPEQLKHKLAEALKAGCRRFDGALKGIGGCPFAQDALIGNIPTEQMIDYFDEQKLFININKDALLKSLVLANSLFA
jgi:hydroxymethylglutaryl-CoA lyase